MIQIILDTCISTPVICFWTVCISFGEMLTVCGFTFCIGGHYEDAYSADFTILNSYKCTVRGSFFFPSNQMVGNSCKL